MQLVNHNITCSFNKIDTVKCIGISCDYAENALIIGNLVSNAAEHILITASLKTTVMGNIVEKGNGYSIDGTYSMINENSASSYTKICNNIIGDSLNCLIGIYAHGNYGEIINNSFMLSNLKTCINATGTDYIVSSNHINGIITPESNNVISISGSKHKVSLNNIRLDSNTLNIAMRVSGTDHIITNNIINGGNTGIYASSTG